VQQINGWQFLLGSDCVGKNHPVLHVTIKGSTVKRYVLHADFESQAGTIRLNFTLVAASSQDQQNTQNHSESSSCLSATDSLNH
jgi:hypothetical protein